MRINVDGYALRDPRMLRLARKLGLPRQQVLGQLMDVWAICYDRVTDTISPLDIDTAAEMDGFAVAMCDPQIELASLTRNGMVRVSGAAKRIRYLQGQSERGSRGGKKSAETRASKQTLPESEATPKRTLPETQAVAKPSGSGSGSSSGSGSTPDTEDPPIPPKGGSTGQARKSKAKLTDTTPDEAAAVQRILAKLTERTGVAYEGGELHTKLIVRQLRSGITEREMRAIAAYCWSELGWSTKTSGDGTPMSEYLCPETLYGPQKIQRYLPPARAWLAKHFAEAPAPSEPSPIAADLFSRHQETA